jgi:adenosylcobinamide kinase/adenosylcobinamide-phosphate guanylyltransferase
VINEGRNIGETIRKMSSPLQVVVIDCLGLWLFNLLEEKLSDAQIEKEFEKLALAFNSAQGLVILVSNEVGCGLVPDYFIGRRFRDLLGRANQIIAKAADEVFLMQIGFPMQLKSRKD